MNKRFSTLLATVMVAGGFSFNAMATSPADEIAALKGGEYVQLKSGNYVLTNSTTGLKFVDEPDLTATDATLLSDINKSLWLVTVGEDGNVAGKIKTYKFQNKETGEFLSIKLQTNKKNTGKGVIANGNSSVLDGAGNAVWAWDATKGLYAASGDSVFFFATADTVTTNSPFSLQSEKAEKVDGVTAVTEGGVSALAALTPTQYDKADAIDLSVAQFNNFLKNGKLYFNGQDVSSTESNVLKDNSWKALAFDGDKDKLAAIAAANLDKTQKFFLTNGTTKTIKKGNLANDCSLLTADAEKKNFLLVDYSFYDASTTAPVYNMLKVDTLAYEPTYTPSDGLVVAAKTLIEARSKYSKYHPATAAFSAKYFVANDSIVLKSEYKPQSIAVATTLVNLGALASAAANTQNSGPLAAVEALVKASSVTLAANEGDYNGGTAQDFPVGTLFTAAEFAPTGVVATGSGDKTGAQLIEAVETYVNGLGTADNDKAAKAAVNTYLNAIKGLKVGSTTETLTSDKFVENKNFSDGVSALAAEATTNGEVVLRQLSKTKVLTISNGDAGDIALLIQPYATKPGIGGDADIAEGVYFIKDMRTLNVGAENKGYGLFFNQTPVGPAYVAAKEDIAKEQAFNPYAQYVIKKAAGTEKGNYLIANLGDAINASSVGSGVTNVVSEGVYAIGTDTFSIVAAATDLEKLDKHMGYKYISEADYKNNKFTITSAADVLLGQTIVMNSDSSLKIADAEMLFTLEPQPSVPFGYENALEYVPVKIMNADSSYIAKSNGQYVYTNAKSGKVSLPAQTFQLIAVDADSTFVLYDGTNKMVISTQYKTISAEDASSARNDLFVVKPEAAPASYKSLPKHVRIQAANGDFAAVNADNQGVAVREGDLKAAYDNLDFIFWLDTAKYTDAVTYKYYITKGVKADEEAGVAASRLYMWNAQDSTTVKEAAPYTYGNQTRVLFRTASIMAQDTLLVPALDAAAKIDTVAAAKGTSVDGLKHDVKGGVTNFQFSFEFTNKDVENEYNIVTLYNGAKQYVHSQNGVLVIGDEKDALVVNVLNVSAEDEAATGNEAIAADGVKVIASEGQIEIAGAQGKKVVVSNILGQVIANTVLTSSDAVIAAPQGVVVVAVEGEEAVKAIVK